MHLRPSDPNHPTIICPRKSIDIHALIQECKACQGVENESCKQTHHHEVPNWHFHIMYNSSWGGYQRANIYKCDQLAARLDSEQCAWDDSWLVIVPFLLLFCFQRALCQQITICLAGYHRLRKISRQAISFHSAGGLSLSQAHGGCLKIFGPPSISSRSSSLPRHFSTCRNHILTRSRSQNLIWRIRSVKDGLFQAQVRSQIRKAAIP